MSFVFERELPSAQHLKELLPVDKKAAAMRERRIAMMKKVMEGAGIGTVVYSEEYA